MEKQVADLSLLVQSLVNEIAELKGTPASENNVNIHRNLQTNVLNSGDTAWMLTSTALVLFMTIPGLMLYYTGIVRTKNVLSTVMQIFSITCMVTLLWMFFGYSLAFGPANESSSSSPVWGDASRFWLRGMSISSFHQLAPNIPEAVFCAYQLTFAIITPSLIVGAIADRMKYTAMLLFMGLWHLLVYCPIAHSMWHPEGFLYTAGTLDFAGGNVVHISAGVSGLVASIMLGHRVGLGTEKFESHSILLTAVGSSMLWVGWFGFNAGSANGASDRAAFALLITQIASATAALGWLVTEWCVRGQPSVLGMVGGAVSGLVAVTPASGFVDPTGAFFIGLLAGPGCYFGCQLKNYFNFDDALDAFGIHAIGGVIGGVLLGFFATSAVDGNSDGVFYADTHTGGTQLGNQIYGIVCTAGWAAFMTFLILLTVEHTVGLRVSEADEKMGLDQALYRETVAFKVDLAPSFEEIVNVRFGSSHGRLQVQELASSHGRPQIPTSNAKLQEYNSTHGHAHTAPPPAGPRGSFAKQVSGGNAGLGSRTNSFTLGGSDSEAIARSQQVPFGNSLSSHGVTGEASKPRYSAVGNGLELTAVSSPSTSVATTSGESKEEGV